MSPPSLPPLQPASAHGLHQQPSRHALSSSSSSCSQQPVLAAFLFPCPQPPHLQPPALEGLSVSSRCLSGTACMAVTPAGWPQGRQPAAPASQSQKNTTPNTNHWKKHAAARCWGQARSTGNGGRQGWACACVSVCLGKFLSSVSASSSSCTEKGRFKNNASPKWEGLQPSSHPATLCHCIVWEGTKQMPVRENAQPVWVRIRSLQPPQMVGEKHVWQPHTSLRSLLLLGDACVVCPLHTLEGTARQQVSALHHHHVGEGQTKQAFSLSLSPWRKVLEVSLCRALL